MNPQFPAAVLVQDLVPALDRLSLGLHYRACALASWLGDCPGPVIALHNIA